MTVGGCTVVEPFVFSNQKQRNMSSFPPDCEHFKLIPAALGVKEFTELKGIVRVLTQEVPSTVLEFLETKYW